MSEKANKGKSPRKSFTDTTGIPTRTGGVEHTSVVNFGAGSASKPPQKLVPIIQVTSGGEQGRVLALSESTVLTLGRAKECDLTLHDVSCSRRHAEIFFAADNHFYLKDLDSTNGSKVNGKSVSKVSPPLSDGDRLQLGDNTILRFSLVPEDDARAQMDVYFRATRDPLTGAFNRRPFDEALSRELSFQNRGGHSLGLVLFDVDFFKKINDSFGHAAGDEVLREIGRRVNHLVRKEDLFARIGGEEFAVILRSDSANGTLHFAERLRESMAAEAALFEGRRIMFTVSVGVCFLGPHSKMTSEIFMQTADEGLYEAKNSGRNRCVLKNPPA